MPRDMSLPRSCAESVARDKTVACAPFGSRVNGIAAESLSGCFNPADSPLANHLDQLRRLRHLISASGAHDHLASAEMSALRAGLLSLFLRKLMCAESAASG